jgi:hypothetical protein
MIIGSTAISNWFSDFKREPKDLDVIIQYETDVTSEIKNTKVEYLENYVLITWILEKYSNIPLYCPADELYTLKISHSFWDLKNKSWDKHVFDIQFLKEKGCQFLPELFWKLFDYWESLHGKRKCSNLEMSAKDFFNNAINFEVEHDLLHELLVQHDYFSGPPTYKKILKEGAEVDVCMNKFNALSETDKFNVVFEEVAVMSIENRFPAELHWRSKYQKMLKKFIINHCKLEEGIWILQNYKKLITEVPFNYEEFLNNKIKEIK